tara:strand:+ start:305 stop:667 length:363 start_codon:yes stop_codon:yes gene_type:complete
MGRRENQKFWRRTPAGRDADKRYRNSVLGIESRIRYDEKRLVQAKIVKALKNGNYDIQDMYAAIRDSFPDHTEKQIFAIMKSYPSKRSSEPSVEEFEDRRGIVIPVTGSFPEYYEESYGP